MVEPLWHEHVCPHHEPLAPIKERWKPEVLRNLRGAAGGPALLQALLVRLFATRSSKGWVRKRAKKGKSDTRSRARARAHTHQH